MLTYRRRSTQLMAVALSITLVLTNLPAQLAATSHRISEPGVALARAIVPLAADRLPSQPVTAPRFAAGSGVEIVSLSAGGAQGTGSGTSVAAQGISDDGRFVVFTSNSDGLVTGDATSLDDVFLRDRQSSTTTLISRRPDGAPGNSGSFQGSVSADGTRVAFESQASDLLLVSDANGTRDVFVRDVTTESTILASANLTGGVGDATSQNARISRNGRYVVFQSDASDLVTADGNGFQDIFVRDLTTSTTTRASVSTTGGDADFFSGAASISSDGRDVSFVSFASNVVEGSEPGANVYLRDLVLGTTHLVSVDGPGGSADQFFGTDVSADGRFVTFIAFESGGGSVSDGGVDSVAAMPGRGSAAPNASSFAPGLYIRDRTLATTTRLVPEAFNASISPDARFVVFDTQMALVPADTNTFTDAYVLDRDTSTLVFVSAGLTGAGGNEFSFVGAVSSDGRFVGFQSSASDLVTGDANEAPDAFLWDRTAASGGGGTDFGEAYPWARGAQPQGATSKDPVNLGTGSLTVNAEDLAMAGRVLGLSFIRWYNSDDPTTGPLGPGWTHTYNWTLSDGGAIVALRRGDGRVDTFTRNPDGSYADPPNVFDTLVKNGDGTFTLTTTNQVRYDFSTSGRLTRIGEPAGNQIGLAYSGGNLSSITDTVGRVVALSYDAQSRLTRLQDPLGRATTYAYDANGRLATVTDRIGNGTGPATAHQWRYAYDGDTRHITSITDPDGRVRVTNTYDAQGRVVQQRDGLSQLTTIAYSTGQTVITDPRGHATTYVFDGRLRVLSQSDPVGANTYTISYTYDAAGNRTSVTDRNGNRTDFAYDGRGNVLSNIDPSPDGVAPRPVTTFAYDTKNNLTRVTDAVGFQMTLTYDGATNVLLAVTRQIDATASAKTTYDYADAASPGMPTRIIAPRGNVSGTPNPTFSTTLAYDAQGNLIRRTDANGAITTFGYDAVGRLVSFVDPDGNAAGALPAQHTWLIAYDELDRETSRTDPLGAIMRYSYDGAGNRISLADRNANVTAYTYEANARLATVQQRPDPLANPTLVYTTSVTRDANGNATRISQANGVATDYAYDALDRPTTITTYPTPTTPLSTNYALDGNGQPTSRTTGDGVTVSYTYDNLGRLTVVGAPGLAISYAYDAVGRRTRMTDATGVTNYQYDGLGRITQVAAPNGTLGYIYDRDGNRTRLTYPGNQSVNYTYSPGGRLTQLTDWANRTSTYTYKPSGLVSTLTYPNAMVASYAYDRAQRLTDLTYRRGAVIASERYTLDPEGNRVALEDLFGTTPRVAGTMQYDGLERLTSFERRFVSSGASVSNETFNLDPASNIASRTGPAATNSYDGANRMTSDGNRSFVWNGADRLTARGSDTFGYDALGRMTSSVVAGTTRTYRYDGDGLLRSRTQGSSTTSFLYDPSVSPAPLLVAGSERLVYGLGPLYRVHANGTYDTFVRDGLGSVRVEVSGTGQIRNAFDYLAYGKLNASTQTPLLGYAGELADPSGLIYLRARWYDPGTGRFMTSDPQGGSTAIPPSLNLYSYALGAPTRFVDPNGNCPVCLLILVNPVTRGAVIGAVSYTVGYFAARLATGTPANDFDFRGLALATVAGAVTGGFGAAAPTAGRVLLAAGVSAAVEETTQLLDNSFSPERLLVSTTLGAFAGLFRANALPALIGFNVLLQTDRQLAREILPAPFRSTTLPSAMPTAEVPRGSDAGGK